MHTDPFEGTVAVVGGGAAGYFAALSAAQHHPAARVVLLEKSNKVLAKVKVSGGGRCNVTHDSPNLRHLLAHYPRGAAFLKKAFAVFDHRSTVRWFAERGVELKAEDDGRMFPVTDSSDTIVRALQAAAERAGVAVRMQQPVRELARIGTGFEVAGVRADRVIWATGGSPTAAGFNALVALGHAIEPPVPSLFTFNLPGDRITALMGVVVQEAVVRIQGTSLTSAGPVLVTHWGLSGPAVLKLSAWGARELAARGYDFKVQVNWIGGSNAEEAAARLEEALPGIRRKQLGNACPWGLPKQFWLHLLAQAGIDPAIPWMELGKKPRNRLVDALLNDVHAVRGKTTFKEEFVTCGGIPLSEVDPRTMGSRLVPGLHFAGEVLDIDGVTGGFNFQAAWTTGFIAGRLG